MLLPFSERFVGSAYPRTKAVLPMVEKVECCEAEAPCSDRDDWLIDRAKQQATNNYSDYGIVTRFLDSHTERLQSWRPEWAAAGPSLRVGF
jgi:hypothetical protein